MRYIIFVDRRAASSYVLVTVRRARRERCAFHIPHSKAHGRRPTTRQRCRGTAFFSYQTSSSIGRSDARTPQRPQNTLCPGRNTSPPTTSPHRSRLPHHPSTNTDHHQSPAHPPAVHGRRHGEPASGDKNVFLFLKTSHAIALHILVLQHNTHYTYSL